MTAQYYVFQREDGWMIRFRDELFGPYKSREQALFFAIDAAQHIGARECEAKVLVEDVKDHFLTKWRYGEPPHVPHG
jgi:hypothetical protein